MTRDVTLPDDKPLFVDLDGTLVNSDLLLESVLRLLKRNVFYLFLLPVWLWQGKAWLKSRVAERTEVRVDLLPYNARLIARLEAERKRGRRLVLVSASNEKFARQVADHLGIFDQAVGSTASENLKGSTKLARILALTGGGQFDYAGNEAADLAVWEKASGALVVNGSRSLEARAAAVTRLVGTLPAAGSRLAALTAALRIHQWAKNLLVFLPLLLSHRLDDLPVIMSALVAFVSFSLCASSVYVLNDMLDLQYDRRHATKASRPFASGALPLGYGLALAPLLLGAAFLVAAPLPGAFRLVLAAYYLLTLLYNFALKAMPIIDVLVLACLYTLRIIAGAAAISVVPTFWLLAFSMFIFMSLAIVKRVAELDNLRRGAKTRARGRGYRADDLQLLTMLGSSAGLMAVLVLALYINADETRNLYAVPEILWFICPLLLFLVSRIWLLASRGQLHEDPVVFFMTDHSSQSVALLSGLLVWAATINWY